MKTRKGLGLIQIYTGRGKGKTTAALGLALRAIGWGATVCMVQFIKGYADIGEAHFARDFPDRFALKQFAIDISRSIDEAKLVQRQAEVEAAMAYAETVVANGEYDIVILDEINNALHYGLVDTNRVLSMIERRPTNVELLLTGRNAPARIIEAADYVTDMKLVKHPHEKGIPARKRVDF